MHTLVNSNVCIWFNFYSNTEISTCFQCDSPLIFNVITTNRNIDDTGFAQWLRDLSNTEEERMKKFGYMNQIKNDKF